MERQLKGTKLDEKYGRRSEDTSTACRIMCSLLFSRSFSCLESSTAPQRSPRHFRQLALTVLTGRSRTFGTHTTVDHTTVALPVAIRSVIVRVGVGCTSTRLEKGCSRSIRNALFRIVANWTGTLVTAGMAVVEECLSRESVCEFGMRTRIGQ